MLKASSRAISKFSVLIICAALFGWLFGYVLHSITLALFIWSVLQLRELRKLKLWLAEELVTDPPDASGEWGDVFDHLYRIRKLRRTRESQLLDEINRFQQFSSALKDAVVILDKQFNMQWWNLAGEQLLGLQKQSDKDKPLFNILRDPSFIRYCQRGEYQEPLLQKSPHNSDIELQYTITEFGESEKLLVARDISDLIRLEQTRQDFVANASHELRTPLTVIRGYLETFLDQGNLSGPLTKAMLQMQQQSNRMQSLIGDLLMLSRLDSTEVTLDDNPVNASQLIISILDSVEQASEGKNHHITVDIAENIGLSGREKELHSAFSNLVYNALRYTQAGGNIHIQWRCDKTGGCFSVTDNGPGISSIHLDRLTERFYRVDDDRSSDTGGSGLGLAIVKNVVNRHQGQLKITSTLGAGSTFSCHFPLDTLVELDHPDR
ncbi:MAG: phosphate regulon sensor histidine kinase PhoR [Oceanospirillaceae bacterium]|nr:phosphate regulon sensor histidine kinase PhoR [Oceanospirillaceae bacterium]